MCKKHKKRIKNKYKYEKINFNDKKIIITPHAVERWEERIGEKTTNKKIIDYILRNQDTIERINKYFYVVNNDVVFVANDFSNNMKINTIYGSMKKNPLLNNIKQLHKIKQKYGKIFL